MTLEIAGGWHMYALDGTSIAMVYGTSADGVSLTFSESSEQLLACLPHVLSQATTVAGELRIYGFGPKGPSG
ncbi:MAG: hypothetical protein EXR75_14090 [Myxococcales bacterium]|nr:hypothetical protein [Myxococcales bacterium]